MYMYLIRCYKLQNYRLRSIKTINTNITIIVFTMTKNEAVLRLRDVCCIYT